MDLAADLHPQRRVQVRERFVEQQRRRLRSERPGQGDTLLLASRQRGRGAIAEPAQPDAVERLGDAVAATLLARQAVAHVPGHGHVREQCPVLEDHADATLLRTNVQAGRADLRSTDADRPVVEPFEAGDRSQERRLAAPARTQQCHDLAGRDVDRDLLEHLDGAEPLDGVGDVDPSLVRHGVRLSARPRTARVDRPRHRPRCPVFDERQVTRSGWHSVRRE